jgi:glycyl-tRNA synthetase beta subunit
VRPSERREKITGELATHAKKSGCKLHDDPELLKLVTYLNEYPSVIQGTFDAVLSQPAGRNPDHRDAGPPEVFRAGEAQR